MNIKTTCLIFAFLLLHAFTSWGDDFNLLWNQYNDAKGKDLPQTELSVLGQIIKKAEQEKSYGNLLAAEVSRAAVRCVLSPDSIEADTLRLRKRINSSTDEALSAVWRVSLGKIYSILDRNSDTGMRTLALYRAAMAHPQVLAAIQAKSYEPLLTKGTDSRIFGDDLLHVIAMETKMYEVAHDYYTAHGNRPAAMFMALWQAQKDCECRYSKLSGKLDSLINVYSDLSDCGYVAVQRYICMQGKASVEEQIKYIDKAINKWPDCPGITELKNSRSGLTSPNFVAGIKGDILLPGKETVIKLSQVRNLHEISFKISRLKGIDGRTMLNTYNNNDVKKLLNMTDGTFTPIVLSCKFTPENQWTCMTDSLVMPALPAGMYLMEASADDQRVLKTYKILYCTRLAMVWESLPHGIYRMGVVDAESGQPIKNAHIVMQQDYYDGKKQTYELTTDSKGEAFTLSDKKNYSPFWVYTDNDKFAKGHFGWSGSSFYYGGLKRQSRSVKVFTDRSIYRPGQTVHVSLVCYRQDDLNVKADSSANLHIALNDNYGHTIASTTQKTDEWGTASADFELPQNSLTGRLYIQAGCDEYSTIVQPIQVEEYKRPTFKVDIENYEQQYAAGDTLSLQGTAKTYSGVPVAAAKVSYVVSRRRALWCWWVTNFVGTTVYEGEATTDANGKFNMRVPLTMPDENEARSPWGEFYNFEVSAKVTDNGGETHEGYSTLPLGTKDAVLSSNLPQKALSDSVQSIRFSYRNAAGTEIPGSVRYTLDGKSYRAQANTDVPIASLKSGVHKLVAVCGSDTLKQDFVTFSIKDKKPVVNTPDWFFVSGSQFGNDGKPIYVQVGSSDPSFHIFYSIVTADKVLENGTIDESNAIITRAFTYKKEYGDGITLTFVWVKNGKYYAHQASMKRPLPDKRLDVEWHTFRDKLTPGQKEEWTLSIKRNGKPASAQFMATMYDASLDQITSHSWPFALQFVNNTPSVNWVCNMRYADSGILGASAIIPMLNYKSLQWRTFNSSLFEDFDLLNRANIFIRGSKSLPMMRMAKQNMAFAAMVPAKEAADDDKAESKLFDVVPESSSGEQENAGKTEVGLRENMQETAFFYPSLVTDDQGIVSLRFTLPESVTTWRVLGLAHDKDMNYGSITAEAVAQKAVMVQPNLPRFIRIGDKPSVGVRVFNTQDHAITGRVSFILMDANTEKVVSEQQADYAIDANGSVSKLFAVDAHNFSGHDMLIARVVAQGSGYSDGEQDYLPVLPDREMVTNTLPFTQNAPGLKTMDIGSLFPDGVTQKKLTIEYTNNPAWLMVQALPFVAETIDNNALSLSSALYANSIGAYIMKSTPQMKHVIDQWRMEKGDETSLMSNLEKNADLKQQLLSETPWTFDAQNEHEQRHRLARFFDENGLQAKQVATYGALAKLQNSDGSFCWWKGMPGSYMITTAVVKMLVRLNRLIGNQSYTADMINKAFSFMDAQAAQEVKELKKQAAKGVKKLVPSDTSCDYLYACALSGRKQTADITYLVGLLKSMPTDLTIYGKANSAVILAAYGQSAKAEQYLQSLKQYTVSSEEMGCYFDTPKAYYSWFDYRIPTQTAAIEALQMLRPGDPVIRDMKRWLLQEKRTQTWDTPINSVNAIYAFLNGNMQVLDAQPVAKLYVDAQQLENGELTAGTGYVKVPNAPLGKLFKVDKTSTGTSWGAVYAQFMQPSSQVADEVEGLSIHREIVSSSKEASSLKVGDKIKVRITIKASRDYDYVEVADKRAACLEPVSQLSGYRQGCYVAPHDNATYYYFDRLAKGTHVLETEYYIDRQGVYSTGTCTVQCAYAPEYSGREKAKSMDVEP